MKKSFLVLMILILCLGILNGCQCSHQWQDATCSGPKTCSACGLTEGEALSHTWADATCDAPKTCTLCGKTDGNPLTHKWTVISCGIPRTCSRCNKTDGAPISHGYGFIVTPPTALTEGFTTELCGFCGDSYIENIVPPLDTDTAEGTLVFRTDGVAYLYGADNQIVKTYTGWMTEKYLSRAPWYPERMSIKTVIIEDGISPASTNLWFLSCENLTVIVIGDGITSIGDYAFFDCMNLESITIPTGIKHIGEGAFFQCHHLVMIYYNGTQSDWSRIAVHNTAMNTNMFTWVKCTDGRIRVDNGG